MTHVADHEVDDLIQEVFLAVFQSAERYRGASSVRTWIFAIASNVARANARKDKRRREREKLRAVPPITAAGPDDSMIEREMLARLQQALQALSHHQRVAFVMCEVEEIPGTEAAHALGIPTGTLYRRLHEARKKLRKALEDES